ncbi:MAG: HDOD domain-containing protein [Pseudomonadota bacterium]
MTTATETTEVQNDALKHTAAAFEFVTALTRDLNRGTVELPSFPDIAMKVKRVLEDDNTTSETIARVVSSEPGLASRVLKMANSAANQRAGNAILDVPRAVGRLGRTAIRTLAVSYAMQNMMEGRRVLKLKPYLNELWNHSIHVAAIARSLARMGKGVDADEAMFVGLIHEVGKLYILTRVEEFPALFDSDESIRAVLADWNVAISQSIVENWGFAAPIIEAVAQSEEVESSHGEDVTLADVVCAANLVCTALEAGTIELLDFGANVAFRRVGLSSENYADILEDSREEITAMMSALNG